MHNLVNTIPLLKGFIAKDRAAFRGAYHKGEYLHATNGNMAVRIKVDKTSEDGEFYTVEPKYGNGEGAFPTFESIIVRSENKIELLPELIKPIKDIFKTHKKLAMVQFALLNGTLYIFAHNGVIGAKYEIKDGFKADDWYLSLAPNYLFSIFELFEKLGTDEPISLHYNEPLGVGRERAFLFETRTVEAVLMPYRVKDTDKEMAFFNRSK